MLAFTLIRSPAQESPTPTPAPDQIMVNVLGAVVKPARVALPKGGTVLDAIASAGGLTSMGDPTRLLLIHKSTGEKPDSVTINLKPVLAGTVKDIPLRNGDTVVIKERMVNF